MTEHDPNATDAGEPAARRMTPTERYHELALLAASRQQTSPEHSLELTRNAKGDVQIALTVRGTDLAHVTSSATEAFDSLCTKYARVDAGSATGGEAV